MQKHGDDAATTFMTIINIIIDVELMTASLTNGVGRGQDASRTCVMHSDTYQILDFLRKNVLPYSVK